MNTEEQFWAAVNWLKTLPDPRAKLLASQAALVGDMREALKAQDAEIELLRREHDAMKQGLQAVAAALYAAQESVQAAAPMHPDPRCASSARAAPYQRGHLAPFFSRACR